MNATDIINQLKIQLQNSADLDYVEDTHIFIGKRTNIANYPVIVIEPNGDRVVSQNYPYEEIILKVIIAAGIKIFDENKQIVGSSGIKGIVDFKNDIKKALSSDHTLDGKCSDLNIIDSIDDSAEEYPIRGFLINIEILYQQDRTTRA